MSSSTVRSANATLTLPVRVAGRLEILVDELRTIDAASIIAVEKSF